jgi:hypothetical protein
MSREEVSEVAPLPALELVIFFQQAVENLGKLFSASIETLQGQPTPSLTQDLAWIQSSVGK